MPRRSKVMSLPPDERDALNAELVERGFQDYEGLEDWLAARGYAISKSSLHRYGSRFEQRLQALRVATEQARAIAEQVGDDEAHLSDALTSLIQQGAFEVLVEMLEEGDYGDVSLVDLGHMQARLGKTAVAQKKWQAEVRQRAAQAADEAYDELTTQHGLSDEAAADIRKKILGVAP